MRGDGGHARQRAVGRGQRLEVVDRCPEPDGLGGHRHAGLEALRRRCEGRGLHADDLDHGSAGEERRHRLEEVVAAPEHADAGRTEHLVARERDEVDAEGADVDRHVRHRLAGVEDDERADRVRRVGDLLHRGDRAEHVALVGERDDLGARGDDAEPVLGVIEVEPTVLRHADPAQDRPGLVADLLPRHEVGVVLHLGHHDLVARREDEALRAGGKRRAVLRLRRGVGEGVRDQVDRLGGVLGEHQLARLRAQEVGDALTGVLVGVGGLLREEVRTAVHRGVVPRVEAALGVQHRGGLLRRCPGVQVDQPVPAAHGARQDREVGSDGLVVEQAGHRGGQSGHAEAAAFT